MAERRTLRKQATACALSAVLTLGAMAGQSSPAAAQTKPISDQEAHAIAVDAYLYFYPLVTMDITRKQFTNVEPGKELGTGPMNTFANVPEYPPADFKGVVRPNFDTLYSSRMAGPDARSRWSSRCRTPTAATTCCRCSTCGRTCSPRRAGAPPARRRATFLVVPPVAAGLATVPTSSGRGHAAHRRADALRLDHRPHQDRRPAGLRRGAQDPGGLQDHAAVANGARHPKPVEVEDRPERRHEDAAEDTGRHHAGRQVLRLRGRAAEAPSAAPHR